MLRFLCFITICAAVACGDDGSPKQDGGDAGAVDAASIDTGLADARVDSAVDAGGCPSLPPTCMNNEYRYCEGTVRTVQPCDLGCSTSTIGCAKMVPSNVSETVFARGRDFNLTSSAQLNTTTCYSGVIDFERMNQSSGAPTLCVFEFQSFHIFSGATLSIVGQSPFVIVATADVTIDGTLDISGVNQTTGAGGSAGGTSTSRDGAGMNNSGGRAGAENGNGDSGGGGGSLCGLGGAGGLGGSATGGNPGITVTSPWDLSPLFGGSGGGFATGDSTADMSTGKGGAGGGALQITALGKITVNGRILAGGGAGGGAAVGGGGGGGGSGGAILLEAPVIEFTSNAVLNAAGGGGGGAADDANPDGGSATAAQNGTNGFTTLARASGGTGVANGGEGGGGTDINASAGENGTNGGGGGGGTGCILLRNFANAMPSLPEGAVLTPSIAPAVRVLPLRTR